VSRGRWPIARVARVALASVTLIAVLAAPASAQDAGALRLSLDTAALSAALVEELRATNSPGAAIAVVSGDRVVLANRNGAIFGRTERRAMEMMLPLRPPSRPAPASPSASVASADSETRRRLSGVYVNGPDTLRLTARGDSLFYRHGSIEQRARVDGGDILVTDAAGRTVQRFFIARGRGGNVYLHDGTNAFLRIETPGAR
jgi:hypothetical protein